MAPPPTGPGPTGGPSGAGAATSGGRGGAGRGAAPDVGALTGSGVTASLGAWELWWDAHQDVVLQGMAEHRASVRTGTNRPLFAPADAPPDLAPPRERIGAVLTRILATETDPELVDSAVLALARVTTPEDSDAAFAGICGALRHDALSVRTSATLSLGVLGAKRATPLLYALLTDAPSGRAAVGGPVPWQVRAYAAIALGLINEPVAVAPLVDIAAHAPEAGREVRTAAVVALGLMHGDHAGESVPDLLALLDDAGLDSVVRAAIPIALARVGDSTVLPRLLAVARDRTEDPLVRQSAATALGSLADLGQAGVVAALQESLTSEADAGARRAAALGLARIGGRSSDPAQAAQRASLERTLEHSLLDPGHRADRPWLALAAALYAQALPSARPALGAALRSRYDKAHDPSERGALALALGLADERDAAPGILDDFRHSQDDGFRGYAAVSLGLLRCHEAAADLLPMCRDATLSDALRQQVVRGLSLMDDPDLVPALIEALAEARTIDVAWSLGRALGARRDPRSVEALAAIAVDASKPVPARAFACVALGLLGDKAELRFSAEIARDGNDLLPTDTMAELLSL